MINVSELKKEVDHLNYILNGITKYVCILNSRDENIDVILGMGKLLKEMKGIGYILVNHLTQRLGLSLLFVKRKSR